MKYFLSGILEEICDQVDEKGIEGAYGYIVGNLLPDFLLCFVGVGELNMAAKAAKATEAAEKTRSTKWGRGAAAGAKTSGEAAKLRGFGRFGELIADFGEWNKLPVFVTPEGFTMKGDATGRFFADFNEFRQVKNAERAALAAEKARLAEKAIDDIIKNTDNTAFTKGFDATPLRSNYTERFNQTPVNNGKWTGERGESIFMSDAQEVRQFIDEAGVIGVKYKNAIPDFSPFSVGEVKIEVTASRPSNFAIADEMLAKQWSTKENPLTKADIKRWRTDNNYTWHELNDGATMQLVPSEINIKHGHLGGISEVK